MISIERDLGLKRKHLRRKLEHDEPSTPSWRRAVTKLLDRKRDRYTKAEARQLAKLAFTEVDQLVVENPDTYGYEQVMICRDNQQLFETAMARLDGKPTPEPDVEAQPKQQRSAKTQRWSLGIFRNAHGVLSTAYVRKDGTPVPYERSRMQGAKILYHNTYSGMPYREARVLLFDEAAKRGIE